MKYARIISEFSSTPWAILPDKLAVMTEFLEFKAAGGNYSDEEILQRIGATAQAAAGSTSYQSGGAIAVIPVMGAISQRLSMMQDISGGASTENIGKQISDAIADPSVGSIVLNIDSPGGSVYGVKELANMIYQARGQKKIVAVANSMAASAAYWIGSAAEEFVVTPGGDVGSIGVFTSHVDLSKAYEDMGVKHTLVSAGKYKVEGNPYQPLDTEALANLQSRVDEYYGEFVKAVAKNRGVSVNDVRDGYGQGRVVSAKNALSQGMVDRIATLDEVISSLSNTRNQKSRANANRLALAERI